jgi:hypothetical protein
MHVNYLSKGLEMIKPNVVSCRCRTEIKERVSLLTLLRTKDRYDLDTRQLAW